MHITAHRNEKIGSVTFGRSLYTQKTGTERSSMAPAKASYLHGEGTSVIETGGMRQGHNVIMTKTQPGVRSDKEQKQ